MVQANRILSPFVAIAGPTAIGKSELAVELALRIDGEIVSADSMQIYRGMRIGTAAPTDEERKGIPHHLIGIADYNRPFSVNDYVCAARRTVAEIFARGKTPVVVGGTGMYLRGLLYGYHFESTGGDEALRARYLSFAEEHGKAALHARLAEKNPQRAAQLHVNDVKRVVRALELEELGRKELPVQEVLPHRLFVLDTDRTSLYARIDGRVRRMFELGLADEVRALLADGAQPQSQAMRAIGYAEIVRKLLAGDDPNDAESEIAQNTRRYAKRQLTYFRAMQGAIWLDIANGIDAMCDIIERRLSDGAIS